MMQSVHTGQPAAFALATLPSAASGGFVSFEGAAVPGTITQTAHTWTADTAGLYHTATDLSAEWVGIYQKMLTGQGGSLTGLQRQEGQAEAFMEHTGLSKLTAARQTSVREDVQRELDAIGAAAAIDHAQYGSSATAPFTVASFWQLERTLQSTPQLAELAIQGHGLNHPPLPRYAGYTADAQHADDVTRYVGSGPAHHAVAVRDVMDDAIMSHACFASVMRNGNVYQLNQNGDREQGLNTQVTTLNRMMFGAVLTGKDFRS